MSNGLIKTSCKDCVFAIYDGKTQTGCYTNALHRLEANNGKIVEAYDEEKEFYLIEDRICIECRHKEKWNKLTPDMSIDEMYETVKMENTLKVEVLVLFNLGDNIQELENTLTSLNKQKKFIKKIHIVNTTGFTPVEIRECLKQNIKNVAWSIESMQDDYSIDDMVHYGFKKINVKHTLIVETNSNIADNYLEKINKLTQIDMKRVILVEPNNNYHGMFIVTQLNQYLGKTKDNTLLSLIKHKLEEEKCLDMMIQQSYLESL
jgi:hypothetical protein